MKKLHFRYCMDLEFSHEIREHHLILHCRPMEVLGQGLTSFAFRTLPEAEVCEIQDKAGSRYLSCMIKKPHDRVRLISEGTVERNDQKETVFSPVFRYPSVYTQVSEEMRCFAEALLSETAEREPLKLAVLLMDRMQGCMTYVPGSTNIKTTAQEAFCRRQGVCQDYAHILTALCRFANIPARYVAGMMIGEGVTHAWTEIWDGTCWHGLDPTHNGLVSERYIKLNHGRDFADAAVDRGCFLGKADQRQTVSITVYE